MQETQYLAFLYLQQQIHTVWFIGTGRLLREKKIGIIFSSLSQSEL